MVVLLEGLGFSEADGQDRAHAGAFSWYSVAAFMCFLVFSDCGPVSLVDMGEEGSNSYLLSGSYARGVFGS